jgi:endonuclease/exonuclease/phosphatase family metal-dependent hydrolase
MKSQRNYSAMFLAVLSIWIPDLALSAPTNSPAALTVTTYNLRFASSTPPNAWPQRRPIMVELIRKLSPDVMGTQEGLYSQLKDLAGDFPEYDWIGLGREGGSRGEFMAVFYRKARLKPLAYDHFWLSDTPELMNSATWGNTCRRMVTWVRFRDRLTGAEFYVFNTHFDHLSQMAREKSAELVRQRIAALKTDQPVLLTGDFNSVAGTNKTYAILTSDHFLSDTWLVAPEKVGDGLDTFNSFKAVGKGGRRIDWILTRGKVEVLRAEISDDSRNGQFPSDHFPVTAVLKLPTAQ